MHKVKIDGDILYAKDGQILSEILIKNGKHIEHLCGGRGVCRKCIVLVDGKEELSCRYSVNSDICVYLPQKSEIVSVTGAYETGEKSAKMCFALDVGTTTLALALVRAEDGKIVKVVTGANPQRLFGADVITRIDYCKKNGVKQIQSVLINEINKMVAQFDEQEIPKMYVSGNTTMLHIMFGVDPSSMGVAPYIPTFLHSKTQTAKELGIKGVKEIESLPSIAAFVGADIVSGMNYIGKPQQNKYNLLVDLGTNAEVVLYSDCVALCTAAAAGPCFEGANISCGMSATNGAIYTFSLNEDGEKSYQTIGETKAAGICGTGLVDIITELVNGQIIDETGYMDSESYLISDDVFLSDGDIRQFQLAKSAVYSAIIALMKRQNVSFSQIENMYISGGFSAKINIENAVKIGLLPRELKNKCIAINNSSLLGAVKYISEQNDLSDYTNNAEYVDLSADPNFADLFMENMELVVH